MIRLSTFSLLIDISNVSLWSISYSYWKYLLFLFSYICLFIYFIFSLNLKFDKYFSHIISSILVFVAETISLPTVLYICYG